MQYRHEQALVEFEAALALDPGDAPTLANKATSLQMMGRPRAALATYELAVEADPAAPEIRFNQGTLLQAMGRFARPKPPFAGPWICVRDTPMSRRSCCICITKFATGVTWLG